MGGKDNRNLENKYMVIEIFFFKSMDRLTLELAKVEEKK